MPGDCDPFAYSLNLCGEPDALENVEISLNDESRNDRAPGLESRASTAIVSADSGSHDNDDATGATTPERSASHENSSITPYEVSEDGNPKDADSTTVLEPDDPSDQDEENKVDEEDKVIPAAEELEELMRYNPPSDRKNEERVEPVASRPTLESLKYLYSMGLLIFSVSMVMAAIFTKQTVGTDENGVPPFVAFVAFWFLIAWLAMMEGGQGALVGLQPIDKTLYAHSHRRTLRNTSIAHQGDNMERFIVGRQFLVVLVVFGTNMLASAVQGASVLDLPSIVGEIFLESGLAVILVTIILGQLTAQVNASNCMLDFINNYFMLFTIYVSLAIEASGLLHCVYLVNMLFSKIGDKPEESNEPRRSTIQNLFFWLRVLFSLAVLGFSFAVTLSALFEGKTAMWNGVPVAVSVVVFFLLMAFVGLLDGMQIAIFAVVNLTEEELQQHPTAAANCKLTFTGENLQAFLIGRQICVTCCMFVVARITSVNVDTTAGDETIFGVSVGIQSFFNTGLLGAVITTIVASLIWRVAASSFPLVFLSNPLVGVVIRLCLILEESGVCYAAWLLAMVHKQIAGYRLDEAYIGTQEERAETAKNGKDLELQEEAVKTDEEEDIP